MPKKIFIVRSIMSANEHLSAQSGVAAAFQYTTPVLRETEGCSYIEFYAYDPELGKLRRKRIKTNRIKGVINRRQYCRQVIKRLIEQLSHGWNPWIAKDVTNLMLFDDAVSKYEQHSEKMLTSGYF